MLTWHPVLTWPNCCGVLPPPNVSCRGGGPILWGLGIGAAIAAASALYVSGHAAALQTYLMEGPLGRSGLLASFCLIFLSELGDKTFFIAALLAMKLGRWISFVGSVGALAVMTLISVSIGAAFSRVPESLQSSLPVGEIAGVALLVFFGIKALRVSQARQRNSWMWGVFKGARSVRMQLVGTWRQCCCFRPCVGFALADVLGMRLRNAPAQGPAG